MQEPCREGRPRAWAGMWAACGGRATGIPEPQGHVGVRSSLGSPVSGWEGVVCLCGCCTPSSPRSNSTFSRRWLQLSVATALLPSLSWPKASVPPAGPAASAQPSDVGCLSPTHSPGQPRHSWPRPSGPRSLSKAPTQAPLGGAPQTLWTKLHSLSSTQCHRGQTGSRHPRQPASPTPSTRTCRALRT